MKRNNYSLLVLLLIVSTIDFFIMFKFGITSNIRYIPLLCNLLIIVFCKENDILPLIFFMRPNFGMYDNIEFKYIFNFTIIICAIKLLLFSSKRKNISKKILTLLVIIFLYNAALLFVNNLGFQYLITYISLFLSYILLIIYSKEKIENFDKIFLFYSFGMIMSVLCGALIPITKYGFPIPSGYRFAALMRDPNGYSFDLLFLIIGSIVYSKLTKKSSIIFFILFIIFGMLGISKMYIICLAFIVIYMIPLFIKNINLRYIKTRNLFLFIIVAILFIALNRNYHFLTMFNNNFITRFNSQDLTSGRNSIVFYYLSLLLKDPITLIFGRSLEYYQVIGYDGWGMVHNTWLEVLFSFGIIGTVIYSLLIYNIIKASHITSKIIFKKELILILIITFFCLNSLPILSGDTLAILILYIILIKNIFVKEKNIKDGVKNE